MLTDSDLQNLSSANIRRVASICERLHAVEPGASFVEHCQAILHKAFGNIHFSAEVCLLDTASFPDIEIQMLSQDCWIPLFKEQGVKNTQDDVPTPAGANDAAAILRPAPDIYRTALQSQTHSCGNEAQNQIWVGLCDGNELLNCIYSRQRTYTESQLAMICLIQPHLATSWKNWKHTLRLQQQLDLLRNTGAMTEKVEAAALMARQSIDALSPRQREVVARVGAGMDNQQIADELGISVWTVKKHMQAIFQALDIQHRTELAATWHKAQSIRLH